jgi:hypothetical protein
MKTFIWLDFEHEFIAANAETLEAARELAAKSINEKHEREVKRVVELYDGYAKTFPHGEKTYELLKVNFEEALRRGSDDWIKQIRETEPMILDENQAGVFDHSNA